MSKNPTGLHPLNDCVLVELQQSHKQVSIKEGKYDTRTEGIVVAIAKTSDTVEYKGDNLDTSPQWLVGKRVHFEEFKEGARIKRDGKIYSFIKIEDIRGYEDNEQAR